MSFGVVGGLLSGCGDSQSDTQSASRGTATEMSADTALNVSSGTEIPRKTVKFGMAPFGDASFYVIAMRRGWFNDVGIDVQPQPDGVAITPDNVVQKMVTGEVDVATFYGPGKISSLKTAKQLKMFGFSDTYLGNYLLAAPGSGAKPVSELVKGGASFEDAIKQTMSAVKGKPVAFTNTGQHRDFLQGIFTLAGLSFKDVDVTAAADARILALAKSGKVPFVSPEGAAQNVELLNQGWIPIVSTDDLLSGLPAGDARAVATIGHEGPAASEEWLSRERETALRFLSVMYRTIDAIQKSPDEFLADQAPYLTARSGVNVSVDQLKTILSKNDPLVNFEDQTQYWTDLEGPRSYRTVYGAQIKSAQEAGVLPKGEEFTPEDAIVGKEYYDQLVALKKGYEQLAGNASELSGDAADLAAKAKGHYEIRNYLDAYRLIRAATSKS